MEFETGSQARSTLAEALYCPAKVTIFTCPGDSSNESSVPIAPVDQGPVPLSGTSRAIASPTVAFNKDQICSILGIVADESAHASFEMLNSVVQRASRLSLGSFMRTVPRTQARSTSGSRTDTDIVSDSVITYGTRRDYNSPSMTSEVESRQDFQSSVSLPSPLGIVSIRKVDPQSMPESPACSSPGAQTLATLKQDAIRKKRQSSRRVPSKSRTRGPPRPRRRVGRIMKEVYFDSMPWTRSFASAPLDPK